MSGPVDLAAAVEQALRAPSVHNTQPWRWRIRREPHPGTVELHADWSRQLHATDPERRDLVLSCGAALHHLRAAFAAQGVAVDVERFPDPENDSHLATVTLLETGAADQADAALCPAIEHRRTDRRRMSHQPVAPEHLDTLAEQARRIGAALHPVHDPTRRDQLLKILTAAARDQELRPGYLAELETWTHRYAGARDGVPAASLTPPSVGTVGPSPLRWFPPGRLAQPHLHPGQGRADAAALVVLTTGDDGVADRLLAGEATSAVLLAATGLGLATTALSQGLESATHRRAIGRDVLGSSAQPQLIIRVGRPASGAAQLPATPRRELRSVLLPQ